MSDIVFLDTETTGLAVDDDIWEFAAIRRSVDGFAETLHLFIEHDGEKCVRLPDSFREDHSRRYDSNEAYTPARAAREIAVFLAGRPHIVGAVPNFDTERLAILLRRFGYEPPWHYHLIDVENLAVGWLAARNESVTLPWNSDILAAACGVEPQPESERHTAMGDVLWVKRWYDTVMAGELR